MHLIVFSDGTWNTPEQMDGDTPAPTNVVKLRNALAEADKDGRKQKAYYHPGVGTGDSLWNRVAGGGMGEGLDNNIVSAYNWLARNYVPGAKIWLFGFSRGAYTVRSLGGMIGRCGLLNIPALHRPETEIWDEIKALFQNYRMKKAEAPAIIAADELPFHGVAQGGNVAGTIDIHCIGVWDTVGALGVPDDMALLELIDDPTRHAFHDTNLSPIVKNARHAVAIDEKRQSFAPALWTGIEARPEVKQLWFPGVHGDVGGGYGRTQLSDGALLWMMDECEALGLRLRDDVRNQLSPNARGVLHDSMTGVFKRLKTRPREVPAFRAGNALLHHTAWERHSNPPLSQGDYWKTVLLQPGEEKSVDVFARQHWNATGIYLEQGGEYRFTAEGEWMDASIPGDPDGATEEGGHLAQTVKFLSTLVSKGEALYTKVTGNHHADFTFSRREDDVAWFALMGTVANGYRPDPKPDAKYDHAPHETFLIGKSASFTPKLGGYLHAFANDVWQTYENNKGSVRLTVKRIS